MDMAFRLGEGGIWRIFPGCLFILQIFLSNYVFFWYNNEMNV